MQNTEILKSLSEILTNLTEDIERKTADATMRADTRHDIMCAVELMRNITQLISNLLGYELK
jgi:hypothetical protein